ncbi:hypothetical protein B0H17DRAFT_1210444 [Mycena rosella]|uniref:DUF6532 domain-containing protein n=1 Tax=Mycena rosella TaxID=1033263 RepID=A0AAD7G526_MYCRO|nr:hypothetical protein B0H17DRAFT_1210444 [Mycena rosella]
MRLTAVSSRISLRATAPGNGGMVWATECFQKACAAANQHYVLTERMIKLITKRGSHARGQIVAGCRNLFASHYGLNRPSTSTAVVNANRALSAKLVNKAAFHYKDVDGRAGFDSNSILGDIRHLTTFRNKKALGGVFTSHFNPYPLETAALEFTTIAFCASEWSTGTFVAAQFFEKDVVEGYKNHLASLVKWNGFNKEVVENIHCTWYTRASCSLKLSPGIDSYATHIDESQENVLREELARRTGAMDSESEQPVVERNNVEHDEE